MKPFDITLLTYEKQPDLTSDDQLLHDALVRRGTAVRVVPWSDARVRWAESSLTMFRSTWDYFHRAGEFQHWLKHVEPLTCLVNDAGLVRWNMHKRYLADLEARGIAVVPTEFVNRYAQVDLAELCEARGWGEIVIKPCIAGSAFGARRFDLLHASGDARAYLGELAADRDAMVQPFLREVEHEGERSLVFIGGEFSHAARKAPFSAAPAGGQSPETVHDSRHAEIAFAECVFDALPAKPLYARVDLVPAAAGWLVMEVELIEPVLFFRLAPSCADRLADMLLGKLYDRTGAIRPRNRGRRRSTRSSFSGNTRRSSFLSVWSRFLSLCPKARAKPDPSQSKSGKNQQGCVQLPTDTHKHKHRVMQIQGEEFL